MISHNRLCATLQYTHTGRQLSLIKFIMHNRINVHNQWLWNGVRFDDYGTFALKPINIAFARTEHYPYIPPPPPLTPSLLLRTQQLESA